MSNLIGESLVGATMVGADEDASTDFSTRRFRIESRTTVTGVLYLSPRLRGIIAGRSDLSGSVLADGPGLQLVGVISGGSTVSGSFARGSTLVLQGEVGVALPNTLTRHGRVLSGAGVKPDQGRPQDQIQQLRPYFV